LSNSTLTTIIGRKRKKADLTITIDRSDLEGVMARKTNFAKLVATGKATFEGDHKPFKGLMAAITPFTPTFEQLPGT